MSDSSIKNDLNQLHKFEQTAIWLFWGSFILFLLCYAIRPIVDPDLWWHLKTGEVMVQNGGLLQSDPFNFTGDGVVSNAESTILKGYWLWQLIAYSLYSLFGFNGIHLLNFLTITAMAGVVFHQMRRQKVGDTLTILLLVVGFFLFSVTYAMERPQVISFLFTAILLGQFFQVRDGEKFGWRLPLLMMFWANLHGGFVVGDILLLTFAAGAVIEYRHDLPRLGHILLWVGLGIGASLLNPTGILTFGRLSGVSVSSSTPIMITEFQSTIVRFQQGHWMDAILWLLIALYCLGIWWSRRIYWPELIFALFLAYISVKYVRNIGFFSLGMLPLIGAHLQEGARRRQWRIPSFVSLLLLVLSSLFLLWLSSTLWQGRQKAGPVKLIYPEAAITFIRDSGLEGRMFNDYTYGGYLLWRLSPEIKVFIDGRGLKPKIFEDYHKIAAASTTWKAGRREYEALLDNYAIDYIIQPIYDGDGRIQPLMKGILNRPEWIPIFLDSTVYIFARLTAKNAEAINNYRIEKGEFKTRLLLIINYICQSSPQEIGYQVARAGMLIYLSMYDEAKDQVDAIRAASPNDRSLPMLENELAYLHLQSAEKDRIE